MAEPRKTTQKTAEAAVEQSPAERRAAFLKAIGIGVGGRYKSVYHTGNSMLGSVTLVHIVMDEDETALVFQSEGQKDAPYQVVLASKLAAFTLAP